MLNNDDDILKMLVFDPHKDVVLLKIGGPNPANYQVTPPAMLDEALKTCRPDHVDSLLDARNYLFKKDAENVTTTS